MTSELSMPRDLIDLSAQELTRRIAELLRNERLCVLDVLWHLAEIDRRKLHFELGYNSLFAYCHEGLRLPKASSWRRTTAARLLTNHPEAAAYLLSGRICLSTFVLLRDVLTDQNAREILERAADRTEDEVRVLVATVKPCPPVTDLIRRLPGQRVALDRNPREELSLFSSGPELLRTGSASVPASDASSGPELPRAASASVPTSDASSGLELPRTASASVSGSDTSSGPEPTVTSDTDPSRYIPAKVRRAVWARDGGRCAYVGTDGRRCGSKHQLEFEHIRAFADGGEATEDNIQLLCRPHNQFRARQRFGDSHRAQYSSPD